MSLPTHHSSTFSTNFGDEDEVHPVLIAGAGPAGTLLAFCLAKLGVRPLIVDSNHFIDHEWGRGDALLCRSVEVIRSLGLGETMISSGYPIWERVFWDMTADPPACTTINDFFPADLDIEDLFALAIRQGLVEKILSDETTAICGVKVLRPWAVVDARLDDKDPYTKPVVVTLKSQYGEIRKVKARHVVGCDGGRSSVRRALDKYHVKLEGDAHDSVWSAIDVVGFVTDFPDIKKVPIVISKHGTIMVIPREEINGKNCIRLYCEVDEGKPSIEDVVATIHKVFHPFKFTWDEVNWFTIYTVSQRIASAFDVNQRIFLAGDAAHIHSPKGGLGMNTSLMDTHNLAVKIALVESGIAKRSVLSTYSLERREVATQLVKMDAEMIRIYAEHGKSSNPEDASRLIAFQHEHYAYQAGTNITYRESVLVDSVPHFQSAMVKLIGGEGLIVGRRLLPATVKRYSDGKATKILDAVLPFDGRFTIFLCFGDLTLPGKVEELEALRKLVYRPNGLWARLEAKRPAFGAASVLHILGVTTTSHLSSDFSALVYGRLHLHTSSSIAVPGATAPILFDTASLYTDDITCLSPYHSHAALAPVNTSTDLLTSKAAAGILLNPLHQKWDINPDTGGIVVMRPDGHVGTLTRSLDAQGGWMVVEKYFEKFLAL
ncbi:FAD binding domain-containing protein [Mycena sp. CBHHK59/15]|nr:FAD binding domain-containing protein [Mycena sp. CBHHK59/15]